MKKNKIVIKLIISFLLCLTFNVKAESLGYYLSNNELNYNYDSAPQAIGVKRGDYVYVTAVINDVSGSNLSLLNGRVTVRWEENYLQLVSVSDKYYSLDKSDFKNLEVKEESKTNSKITLNYSSNEAIKQGINKLMEFKFLVLENAPSSTTKIYEMDGETSVNCLKEEKEISCGNSYNSELKYTIKSNDINTLSTLKIDGKEINGFNENIREYTLTVDGSKESINIDAIKKDPKSTITGDIGTRKLEYGVNTFNIDVISESKKKNTYTVKVEKVDSRSKDNTLKDLKISSGIITFKPNDLEYNFNVKNEVDTITIIAILNDSKAKFKEDFSKKVIDLQEGINKISITVIAENNEERTYNLNITRELSGNNTLKELTVNNERIKLSKNEFLYYYTVNNEVETISVNALASDNEATVEIDNIPYLEIGENEVGIRVTAQNGDTSNYTLIITREKKLSNNNKLSNLEIVGYTFKFDTNTEYYDLKINDEDSLNIIYEVEDEKATVEIEGNKNLTNGSIIKINVKAEDNSIRRYFINIEKKQKNNSLLWIILLIILIIIITLITILLIKKNNKKKKKAIVEKMAENKTDIIKEKEDNEEEPENQDINVENNEIPMVDLDKTIVVTDLNPVIEENMDEKEQVKEDNTETSNNMKKKTIDLE